MSSKSVTTEAALPEDTVEVWLLSVPCRSVDAGLHLLDSHERARWGRFQFCRDRRLYSSAHGLLRVALSRYAAVDPSDWRFEAGPFGRPELAGSFAGLGLRFNLSHTRGLAACAITRNHAIGIDVESLGTPIDFLTIARMHFTGSECAEIAAAPAELKSDVFLSLWTLKEAYVKARGVGLSLPLKSFSVTVAPPSIRPGPDDCPNWYASLSRQDRRYLVAVAMPWICRDKPPKVVYREFQAAWLHS